MLTFILVVVLGGGVAYLAVSLAESNKPATDAGPSRRDSDGDGSDAADSDHAEAPEVEGGDDPPMTPVAAPPPPDPLPAPIPQLRRASGPAEVATVPRAYVAVEGRYDDVAKAPIWRRFLALVGIVVITVAVGAAIAAILAAVFGAVAEVLGNAIG